MRKIKQIPLLANFATRLATKEVSKGMKFLAKAKQTDLPFFRMKLLLRMIEMVIHKLGKVKYRYSILTKARLLIVITVIRVLESATLCMHTLQINTKIITNVTYVI